MKHMETNKGIDSDERKRQTLSYLHTIRGLESSFTEHGFTSPIFIDDFIAYKQPNVVPYIMTICDNFLQAIRFFSCKPEKHVKLSIIEIVKTVFEKKR